MAKKKRARRSAIVPRLVLSATLMSGAAVVPTLSGCNNSERGSVACIGYGGGGCLTVAAQGFDMGPDQSMVFTVAAQGFDMTNTDGNDTDAG